MIWNKKAKSSSKIVKGYVCGVDFQHELGEVSDVVIYATVEELKRDRTCWPECGIVELNIKITKWIEPQRLYEKIRSNR